MFVTYPPTHSSRFENADIGSWGQTRSVPIFGQNRGSVQLRPAYSACSAVACDSNSGTESPCTSRGATAHRKNRAKNIVSSERKKLFPISIRPFIFNNVRFKLEHFTPLIDFHCHTYRRSILSVSEAGRHIPFGCSVFVRFPSACAQTHLAKLDID